MGSTGQIGELGGQLSLPPAWSSVVCFLHLLNLSFPSEKWEWVSPVNLSPLAQHTGRWLRVRGLEPRHSEVSYLSPPSLPIPSWPYPGSVST